MSKKTLIILLVIIAVGILVIVVTGRTAVQPEESVIIEDDTLFDEMNEINYEPIMMEEEITEIEETETPEEEMLE